jgi:hypothetical protein
MTFIPRPSLRFTGFSRGGDINLIHLVIIGQSQAGGYNNAPSLTTVTDSEVLTLTSGPLDSNTSTGVFIPCAEGDTYDNGGASSNVETMSTSLGQQLKSFVGGSNYRYCITVHYHGGSSIQNLSNGGTNAANGYDAAILAVNRVKTLSDAEGWVYQTHMIFTHGGNGLNPYGTDFATLVSDWRTDITTAYSGTSHIFCDQQRVIGTPDYGIQLYTQSIANKHVLLARQDQVAIQGDGIHITNHGTRHLAMYYAKGIYDVLFGSGFTPLTIDTASATFNGVDKLIFPILGYTGTITIDSNPTIEIESVAATGTWAVNGSSIEYTITSTIPDGTKTVDIIGGLITDSRSNTGIIFNDGGALPYEIPNSLIRNNYTVNLTFLQRVLINYSGTTNVVSSPDSNARYWNNITSNDTNKNASTAGYTFGSNIVDTDNTSTGITFEVVTPIDGDYFDQAGRNEGGGTISTVGEYVTPSAYDSWFSYPNADQVGGVWNYGSLSASKTYTFKFWGTRAATGTRAIDIATDSGFSDVQTYTSDNNITQSTNAEFTITGVTSQSFYIRSTSGGNDFGYISVVDIDIV